jgi:hypothetical protein
MHNTVNDDVTHVIEFEGHEKSNDDANNKEPDRNMIKPPVLKLTIFRVMDGTWAEEMDRKHEHIADSKYIQASYPPVPSPAPWHPPLYIKIPTSLDPLHTPLAMVQPLTHSPHVLTPPVPPQFMSPAHTACPFQKLNMSHDCNAS